MNFADLVKFKRELNGITLKELEEITGITASYISRIEKNQRNGVSAQNVFKLAQALNISLDELERAFDVKLSQLYKDNIIEKLKNKFDYVAIKQAIDVIIAIANNTDDYYKSLNKLMQLVESIRKNRVIVIGITDDENSDYLITIENNDEKLIDFVSRTLRYSLSANVIVMEGYCRYSDNTLSYDLNEFIEDFVDDEEEKEDILEYIESIKY